MSENRMIDFAYSCAMLRETEAPWQKHRPRRGDVGCCVCSSGDRVTQVEKREFTDVYTTHKVKIGSEIQMEAARSMEVISDSEIRKTRGLQQGANEGLKDGLKQMFDPILQY